MTIKEKLYNGEKLTESELRELVNCGEDQEVIIDKKDFPEGSRRWEMPTCTIFKFEDKPDLWCIDWAKGLTEEQENEYQWQPYKVKKVVKTVATEVVSYEEIR